MATNKLAIIRYQTLDKCFSNPGRRYYMENLIEECNKAICGFTGKQDGIKKRQVFEDIKFMESPQGWNVSLERVRDGHRVYFRYENRNFSINNQLLNETEINQLKEALTTLSKFKGLPQFEWISEITARLDSGLSLTNNKDNIIEFEQNNYLKGLEFISPLYNSIVYNQTVEIEYKSFKSNEKQSFTIHPYFLKQFNNRWFLFGLNNISERIINLALDRIEALSDSKIEFKKNENINFNEYFEDIVGVSLIRDREISKIKLAVMNSLLPYIETKPIHGSQKIKEKGTEVSIITLELICNYELESVLLSFGEGVQVLEPEELRVKIRDRIRSISKFYEL